jgi:hypothetical protein
MAEIETQQDSREAQADFAADLIRSHRLLEKQVIEGLESLEGMTAAAALKEIDKLTI